MAMFYTADSPYSIVTYQVLSLCSLDLPRLSDIPNVVSQSVIWSYPNHNTSESFHLQTHIQRDIIWRGFVDKTLFDVFFHENHPWSCTNQLLFLNDHTWSYVIAAHCSFQYTDSHMIIIPYFPTSIWFKLGWCLVLISCWCPLLTESE